MNRLEISKQMRKKILSYIRRNPGCHFCRIMKRLKLSSGKLTYHILKLEEANKIFAIYDGYWKWFYPISMKGENISKPLTPNQKKIYDLMKKHPGITYKEIEKKFGKTRQSFLYHIKKLTKMNLVKTESVRGEFHFYLTEKEK